MASLIAATMVALLATACLSRVVASPTAVQQTPAPSASATPSPIASATSAPATPALARPLTAIACGWPASAPLAFAGYATVLDLGVEQTIQGKPSEYVYAMVTRNAVELHPMIGSPMLERGFCALEQDGSQVESAVAPGWNFSGKQESPAVACEENAISCTRETLVVLNAVATVGHPATAIKFRKDATCIWLPFHTGSCFAIIIPDGTRNITSAIVSFSDTRQQAFLNLFWMANGDISAMMGALVAPPPGATPTGRARLRGRGIASACTTEIVMGERAVTLTAHAHLGPIG